jgi:hypothetical protein
MSGRIAIVGDGDPPNALRTLKPMNALTMYTCRGEVQELEDLHTIAAERDWGAAAPRGRGYRKPDQPSLHGVERPRRVGAPRKLQKSRPTAGCTLTKID